MNVLVIDVGSSHVKVLASGQAESRKFDSGPTLAPRAMVLGVEKIARDWAYDAISIGYPGPVLREPHNLGCGWVGFNFEAAFGQPVKVINDAAMQALGSYQGGKMLFFGLGTGLGSAMIVDGVIEPMELGHLPHKRFTYEHFIGQRGLDRWGVHKWQRHVVDVMARFIAALEPDDVVPGGCNVKKLEKLPQGWRAGANANGFLGGFRLWLSAAKRTTFNSSKSVF
jgi:polyphosphate glucokinase